VPAEFPFWELTSTEAEELSRRVSVDLLAACHADSELLEILTLSQNFRYREPLSAESESPTPLHVILGAAAFNFANLFDAVRHRENGQHDVAEIIAALKTLAEIPEEHRVLESLEEWLSGRDQQVENYDVALLQQQDLGMDEETLNIVHATFIEILFELHDLEAHYQGFFILDATGRFLLWNYGCQSRLGYSMREMRNKHWTNQLMGYCNEEGLAFSDSQTPLYQTLESAKPAHLTLCLKNSADKMIEAEVNSIPIMGRDGLLLGIVEVHRGAPCQTETSKSALMLTPEWVGDLVDTIHNLDDDAEPIFEVPKLDNSYLVAIEEQLGITGLTGPPSASENSVAAVIEKAEETVSNDSTEIDIEEAKALSSEENAEVSDIVEEQSETDILEEPMVDSLPQDSIEESEQAEVSSEPTEEDSSTEDAVETPSSENLDELFSRFDSLVTDEQDIEQTEGVEVEQAEKSEQTVNGLETDEESPQQSPENPVVDLPDPETLGNDNEILAVEPLAEEVQNSSQEYEVATAEEAIEEETVSEQLEEQQEEVPEADESHEEVAEQLDVEEDKAIEESVEEELNINVEESSKIPETIELPVESPAPETQEVPSPDPGQTDPLAQPVSRKEWDAFVEHLIDPASPDHEQVSVLFLDVDHFKAINEGFGRQIGNDLLTEISRRLSQACGKRELSCRYGGGQFAIACPGINLEKARKRGDQFRKLIDRTRFDVLPFHSLTVSAGIASLEEGDDLTEVMNRAEHGLYQAKQSGRNCSVGVSAADIAVEMKAVEDNMSKLITGEFDVETHFEAMVASDMIVYKLGGFLYDMHAKLLHVDRRHVSMRVGKKGLLPYWGRQDDDRPVLIDLELGEGWNQQRSDNGLLTNTRINVKIRTDGWVRSQETFLKRAHFVLRELKGYFVTN
jgi:diguanylate cyclase (GGDEF)-like protein